MYGAEVVTLDMGYSDVFNETLKVADENVTFACHVLGLVLPQHWLQPLHSRGEKNCVFRNHRTIQPRHRKKRIRIYLPKGPPYAVPDAEFVSVGDGNIISGILKGFFVCCALTNRSSKNLV